MNKRFFANALAIALLASNVPAFSMRMSDVEGTRFADSIKKLSAFGIMSGDGDGNYRPNDTIMRSEVTRVIVHALGLEGAAEASKGESKFPDVSKDHWANGYINVAASQNIVVGDDLGTFRPNDSITYAEAMTIMVKALGYGVAAEQKGGFPQGYLVVGADNGLNKGVTVAAREAISRGEIALMTENALEAKIMDITGFGDDLKYEVTDKTLLKDKLKITKGEGQIVAIENTALDGASNLSGGQIKIDKTVYDSSSNFNNLLGYNVEYYLKDTEKGDNTVILAMPKSGKNSTVAIDAKLFERISSKSGFKTIEYYKNESDSKTSSVLLDNEAKLIYNGKYEQMSDELLNLKDKSGNIVVLDTDKNGKYDIVFVTEYKNIVVDEVSSVGRITDKYNAGSIKLDKDDSNISYTITRGYEELQPSDLKEYDVLSIAVSKDKKLYTGVVTNEIVEGKITGIHSDGVYIDGKLYEIADNYPDKFEMGTEGKFYLDIDGRIAASDAAVQASGNYAYLIKASVDTDIDEIAKFKLFDKSGEEIIVEATEKIKFNGAGGQLATDVAKTLSGSEQLVTYTLNKDGKLSAINTAADNTQTGAVNENKFTMNYKLTNAKYNEKLNTLGNIKLNDKTVIFDIPDDAKDSSDYTILNMSKFIDEQSYNVTVFDRTEDFYAKAIIVTNASALTNEESSVAVVSRIVSATDKNDNIVKRLYAYQDGKEISIDSQNDDVFVKSSGVDIENGDIIQYQTNSKGEIAKIKVLFDVRDKTDEKETVISSNLKTVYGKVVKKFSGSVNMTVNGGNVINIKLPQDTTVYTLDTSKSKNNIKTGTLSDIQSYDSDEQNRLFVKIYKDIVQEVVVIK